VCNLIPWPLLNPLWLPAISPYQGRKREGEFLKMESPSLSGEGFRVRLCTEKIIFNKPPKSPLSGGLTPFNFPSLIREG
jgi:hypothetical protein